jgi:predicted GH43/DUF377 family glycosyl hydrolase
VDRGIKMICPICGKDHGIEDLEVTWINKEEVMIYCNFSDEAITYYR